MINTESINTELLTSRDLGEDQHISENCLPVGTRLAEFQITGVIGEGGFGIVYMTFDHSLRRPVAIKEYMPASIAMRGVDQGIVMRAKRHQSTFEVGLKSFINEARLLAQFDHPALIKVHRFWEQNNTAYMAMRYYEGSTLKEIIYSDPARVTEAWLTPMLQSILEGLDTLYRENILHRDISPDNILIQESGEAVLLDFGSARQILSDMSQSLTVILKPGYAPIEQYADDSSMTQGPWTDIYSLSAVMYLAITKQPPPTSVARIVTDTIVPLAAGHHPGFSDAFLRAIDHGLAVRPEQRPQTIEAFRQLLQLDAAAGRTESIMAAPSMPILPAAAPPHLRRKTRTAGADKNRARRATVDRRSAVRKAADTTSRFITRSAMTIMLLGVLVITMGLYAYQHHRQKMLPTEGSAASVATPIAAPIAPPATLLSNAPVANTADHTSGVATDTQPINLRVKPWANVMIDGVAAGVSPPLKQLALTTGAHRISLSNPNFATHVLEFVASADGPHAIEFDFSKPAASTGNHH